MHDRVNINELINAYWKENECEPFSASETALFFFLLWRAGMKDWEIPFKCSTSYISRSIKISRQSVIAARETLYRRGLIYFTKGNINGDKPKYLVTTNPDEWKETFVPVSQNDVSTTPIKLTDCSTVPLSGGKTDSLTSSFTGDVTNELKENGNHDTGRNTSLKDSIKEPETNKNRDEKSNPVLSLDELEKILMNDKKWQSSILSLLSKQFPLSIEELKSSLTVFFRNQRYQGKDSREENDCRNHFYYWLRKQLEQKFKTAYKVIDHSNNPVKNDN